MILIMAQTVSVRTTPSAMPIHSTIRRNPSLQLSMIHLPAQAPGSGAEAPSPWSESGRDQNLLIDAGDLHRQLQRLLLGLRTGAELRRREARDCLAVRRGVAYPHEVVDVVRDRVQ